MAFTVLKSEKDDFINYNRLVRNRARKKIVLFPEIHPVNWTNVPLDPSTGLEENCPTWNKGLVSAAVQSALRKMQIRANPSTTTTPFYFHTHYDSSRVALQQATPRDGMLRALKAITNIDDPTTYKYTVHKTFENLTAKAAKELARNVQFPIKLQIISRTHQPASPNQVCAYQVALQENGRLEMARFILASQTARFFSEAVTTFMTNPSEEPMAYPLINQLYSPEDILQMPSAEVPMNQLLSPSQSLTAPWFHSIIHAIIISRTNTNLFAIRDTAHSPSQYSHTRSAT